MHFKHRMDPLELFDHLLEQCLAPCIVANSLKLPRYPFTNASTALYVCIALPSRILKMVHIVTAA